MAQTNMALDDSLATPGTIETSSETMRAFLACFTTRGQGVWRDYRGELLVAERSAGASDSVDVGIGAAMVGDGNNNVLFNNSEVVNLAISANSSGNPRIDTVCVHLDLTQTDGDDTCQLVVVEGTPAGSPSPPSLTQGENEYYMPLADVAVADGFTSITDSEITDRRAYASEQNTPNTISQTADISYTTTTLKTHTDFDFYGNASSLYRVWFNLVINTSSSADFKAAFTGPSGMTYEGGIFYLQGGSTYEFKQHDEGTTPILNGDGDEQILVGSFVIKTSTTPGVIAAQFAQNIASGTSYMRKESFMLWEDIT